jgi:ElaB/YqjD/DUF883 family membrane-anchored ribosome-binding protein
MADPLRKPSESDFTIEPFAEPALPESVADVRELVPRDRGERLVDAAETFGSALGSAVGAIRGKVQSGLEVVKKRSDGKRTSVEDLTEKVRDRAERVRDEASQRIQEWSSIAQHRVRILRERAREFSRDRPAELVLAIGGVAMIVGIILRLWRSNRD